MNRFLFTAMYWIGLTPWDGHPLPAWLRGQIEDPGGLTPGRALDIGCGTGDTSIYLARHGWTVTGIDFVKRALDRARTKTAAAEVRVRYEQADVTRLSASGIGEGFDLIVDNGCLHGLDASQRDAYVREVSAAAAPGARLLIMAFAEGQRRGPRGIDRAEVERRFESLWELIGSGKDAEASNLATDPLYFYDLRRL
ncbi:MAG: class I SAM-dependent methyltransferase [Vicinamibacterales bacterium]